MPLVPVRVTLPAPVTLMSEPAPSWTPMLPMAVPEEVPVMVTAPSSVLRRLAPASLTPTFPVVPADPVPLRAMVPVPVAVAVA